MLPGKVIPFVVPGVPQPRATEQTRIVAQVGRDLELLRLRAKIITSAGFIVHSMSPGEALEQLLKPHGATVWVFCHTFQFCELALLAAAIRKTRPADKLIRISGINDLKQAPPLFDETLEPAESVDQLLQVITQLDGRSPSRRKV